MQLFKEAVFVKFFCLVAVLVFYEKIEALKVRFADRLVRGYLKRRYKRFLADVILEDGSVVTVHCADPGAMVGLKEPGLEVWLLRNSNPARKLAWRWELVRIGDSLVSVNTIRANDLVMEALSLGKIESLRDYDVIRREVPYGERSRVDFLLSAKGCRDCYVEVKNVHLSRVSGLGEFPDCVTTRGSRHLRELATMVKRGYRSVVICVIQREDCSRFSIASDLDSDYAENFCIAQSFGVESLCYFCHVSLEGIEIVGRVPIVFQGLKEGY